MDTKPYATSKYIHPKPFPGLKGLDTVYHFTEPTIPPPHISAHEKGRKSLAIYD